MGGDQPPQRSSTLSLSLSLPLSLKGKSAPSRPDAAADPLPSPPMLRPFSSTLYGSPGSATVAHDTRMRSPSRVTIVCTSSVVCLASGCAASITSSMGCSAPNACSGGHAEGNEWIGE
jgi:hypothetical protein